MTTIDCCEKLDGRSFTVTYTESRVQIHDMDCLLAERERLELDRKASEANYATRIAEINELLQVAEKAGVGK